MLTINRENLIMDFLKENETIKTKYIMDHFNISEATARRDLANLEKKDLIKRVHGGAILSNINFFSKDSNIAFRKNVNRKEKEKIAEYAASLIKDNSVIFLDAGTTTFQMIKYLKNKNIKVVTNGLNFIDELEKISVESFLLGGKIKYKTSCTVGFSASKYLETFNFDYVFIGANALNLNGYSTPDGDEAVVKEKAISLGKSIYFLCDHSKVNKNSFIIFSSLNKGKLITDSILPKEYESFKNLEVVK